MQITLHNGVSCPFKTGHGWLAVANHVNILACIKDLGKRASERKMMQPLTGFSVQTKTDLRQKYYVTFFSMIGAVIVFGGFFAPVVS